MIVRLLLSRSLIRPCSTRNRNFSDTLKDVDIKNVRNNGLSRWCGWTLVTCKWRRRIIVTNHVLTYLCSLYFWFYCSYLFIQCLFSMSTGIMLSSYPRHNFLETDAMFLEFEDELDNFAGGLSSTATMRVSTKISFILTYDYFMFFSLTLYVITDLLSRVILSTTCDSDS